MPFTFIKTLYKANVINLEILYIFMRATHIWSCTQSINQSINLFVKWKKSAGVFQSNKVMCPTPFNSTPSPLTIFISSQHQHSQLALPHHTYHCQPPCTCTQLTLPTSPIHHTSTILYMHSPPLSLVITHPFKLDFQHIVLYNVLHSSVKMSSTLGGIENVTVLSRTPIEYTAN